MNCDLSASVKDDSTKSNPLEVNDSNPTNNGILTSPKISEPSETERLESYEELKTKLSERSNSTDDVISNLPPISDLNILPDQILNDDVPKSDHVDCVASEKEVIVTESTEDPAEIQQQDSSLESKSVSETNYERMETTNTLPDQIPNDEVPKSDHVDSVGNEKEVIVKTSTGDPAEIQQEKHSFLDSKPQSESETDYERMETALVEDPQPSVLADQQIKQTEPVPEVPKITTQTETDSSYATNFLKSLKAGGLGLLSAYDSTDDSDASETASVIEVPPTTGSGYRNQVIEIDSDDSEDKNECDLQKKRIELEKLIQVEDSDEEDGESFKKQPLKVQGELMLEDLPPIEDLHITVPEQECVELGTVNSIIDQLLLVKTFVGTPLLDLGTVLFLDKGQKVLGEIFDVLGQVADPLYCVRFNNNQHIKEKEINIGDKVYCAPRTKHTQLIILSNLTKMKGSDASWENDVEPPPKHVDYSDDEEEQAARRSRRMKSRNDYIPGDGEVVDLTKKPRQQNSTWSPQNHPRQQSSHNFYQQMNQQQPFNYQSEGNTWHSNYQPQFVVNPYAIQGGYSSQNQAANFQQNQRMYQNQNIYQGGGGFQQQSQQYQRNFPNRNYQSRGGYSQSQQQGAFQQPNQQYQGQPQFYQQRNGGYP